VLYINADTVVTWTGLANSLTGAVITDATITGILQSPTPYTFTLAASDSSGDYGGVIPAAITSTLVEGQQYEIQLTAVFTGGQDYRCEAHLAQYRGFCE
jgi:hypothetical protein